MQPGCHYLDVILAQGFPIAASSSWLVILKMMSSIARPAARLVSRIHRIWRTYSH